MAIPGLFFFILIFSIQLTANVQYKFLPMTWFEPQTSGIGSNRSTNWATTAALGMILHRSKDTNFFGSSTTYTLKNQKTQFLFVNYV